MSVYSKSHPLQDLMNSATKRMEEDYNRTRQRSRSDPGTAGDQGEIDWAGLLRQCLPATFHVVTKGRILDHAGNESPQVDVLVLRPSYPQFLLEKKHYLSAGVLAAFECKLTLRAGDIRDFFLHAPLVKRISETRRGTPLRELESPLLYGFLAHSHQWKSNQAKVISRVEGEIKEGMEQNILHPREMPDLLCVANLATWSAMKEAKEIFGSALTPSGRFVRHQEAIRPLSTIGAMVSVLLDKLSRNEKSLEPFAHYFREADLSGIGAISVGRKTWSPESAYSDELLHALKSGARWSNRLGDDWCTLIM